MAILQALRSKKRYYTLSFFLDSSLSAALASFQRLGKVIMYAPKMPIVVNCTDLKEGA
jgi:hypothetical protein